MSIGNVIIELRSEHNISQKKLADAIGISQSAIAQIEVNRNEATAATIRKLAAFFDVSADYLLGLENDFGTRVAAPIGEGAAAQMTQNENERELLEIFRGLSPYLQGLALDTLRTFAGKPKSGLQKKA